jgi:hypothetical protein
MNGVTPITIDKDSTYIDAGATAIDNIDGIITNRIQITSNLNTSIAGSYTITYDVVDNANNPATTVTRTVDVKAIDPRYNASKGVNSPALSSGMTPIKWDGSAWVDTTESDAEWYDYTATDKKWANARTEDGSMWVWIPRYIYKIPASNWHTNIAGSISIQFSKGTSDNWNSSAIGNIDTGTTSNASNNKWTNHPAFTFGNTELIGIWVAKFEASGTAGAIKSVPTVTSFRNQIISTFFTASRNMETNAMYGWGTSGNDIDTHLIKNIEWGSIAYLAQSTYGKNSEVWMNPSSSYITGSAGTSVSGGTVNAYNTTNGVNASTTGNIYGIYDMSGGAYEYTAAYVNNGASNLNGNGSVILVADPKYKDVYSEGASDSHANNYAAAANKKGDAIYEISSSGAGATSWYSDNSSMPYSSAPFFFRGGNYTVGTAAGTFNFYDIDGSNYSSRGFRVVLLVETGL